ncbi:MAG: hypothetical protein Q8876_02840 [Bacillota bacterium]|nr:hypothetical protein [Bacillota bacterium]
MKKRLIIFGSLIAVISIGIGVFIIKNNNNITSSNPVWDHKDYEISKELLKEDIKKNKGLYDALIDAINKDNSGKKNFSCYYDVKSKNLLTHEYGGKPQVIKFSSLNVAFRNYVKNSEVPFGSMDASYNGDELSIRFEEKLNKNNLSEFKYLPLFLYYSTDNSSIETKQAFYNLERISDHWFEGFEPQM